MESERKMAELEYSKMVMCPEEKELIEVDNQCVFCDHYGGEAADGNCEGYAIICRYGEKK